MKYMQGIRMFGAAFLAVICAAEVDTAEAAMTRSSAEKLMASGKSLACDYSSSENGEKHRGTLYFSRGKMRGDFKAEGGSSGTYDSHMIQDGSGWAYLWGGPMGETRGTKMRVDALSNPSEPGKAPQAFDSREEVEMDCREWGEDASKFETPQEVEFADLTQMMDQAPYAALARDIDTAAAAGAPTADVQMIKCQICEQLPDEATKAQCRQMLGC